ncbi:MAG: PIN domain-containing protein [Verrucomicrobia bacterium]|nr:PIN domain-containing protein [Verrucomicrobiota bacterium]
MKVLVDTSIWSLVLRSNKDKEAAHYLTELINEGRVEIIGPIRQEILSGIRSEKQFEQLKGYLDAFTDIPLETEDYIEAARCYNRCRGKGIQGSHIDFLICAVAKNHNLSIYTADKDFQGYAKALPIILFK